MNCACFLLFTLVEAHSPKAADPPLRFIMATNMPRITRKIRIPTLPALDRDAMMPSCSRWFMMPLKLAPAYSTAPAKTPMNRELYTSFVISASTMAISGGRTENPVAYSAGFFAVSSAAKQSAGIEAIIRIARPKM